MYSSKDIDRKKELRKLNHSVLVNFLDLIDILIKCPESPKRDEKIEDINLLFIHMHHLINEFRPHQARETLRLVFRQFSLKLIKLRGEFRPRVLKKELNSITCIFPLYQREGPLALLDHFLGGSKLFGT